MKIFHYSNSVPNFGDDLNTWIWPKIMPEVTDDGEESVILLPIGSIIFDSFPQASKKIVLGSGYGGYTKKPTIDKNWKFYFVRGPKTAEALGLDSNLGICDAAILLRSIGDLLLPTPKKYKLSFMPHWESALNGQWQTVTEPTGIHLIDPRAAPETVLDQIRATEVLITEAMHGAIVADALRVPWIPILPTSPAHRFKWLDWCGSLSLDYNPNYVGASTATEWVRAQPIGKNRTARRVARQAGRLINPLLLKKASDHLVKIAAIAPNLSRDSICAERTEQAIERFEAFRRDYRAGAY